MKPKHTPTDVGVIVARFQVHTLTDAHLDLLRTVQETHKKVIVFLGLSPMIGTRNNPLDFEARKQMVLESFPNVTVLYISDIGSDKTWSRRLDRNISDLLLPNQTATLYGGRDSFIDHYTGKFSTQELESTKEVQYSGTEARRLISAQVTSSVDFRAGIIWAVHNRYPAAIPTVDVVIYDDSNDKIRLLMVRKHHESKYRFVGGFAQPDTVSYEIDARREIMEEVGVETDDMKYIGSMVVDDWRYTQETDKLKTLLFSAKYIYGAVDIQDTSEIVEARWFELDTTPSGTLSFKEMLVDVHKPLFDMWTADKYNIIINDK